MGSITDAGLAAWPQADTSGVPRCTQAPLITAHGLCLVRPVEWCAPLANLAITLQLRHLVAVLARHFCMGALVLSVSVLCVVLPGSPDAPMGPGLDIRESPAASPLLIVEREGGC
jgi:hypothetical protein